MIFPLAADVADRGLERLQICEAYSDYFAILQACAHLPHAGSGLYLDSLVRSLLG